MHCRQQQNLAALVVSAERTCRQALLLDQVRDALINIGLGGCITGWNPGAERLFGYVATEALGRDIRLLHVDANDECFLGCPESGGRETTARRKKASGESLWASVWRTRRCDFGTGCSRQSYLKRFPIDNLKLGQSFVRGIPCDSAIARTIFSIAKNVGLSVIAKGVETDAQRDFLREAGCKEIQGYYFSRPLPADQSSELLLRTNP